MIEKSQNKDALQKHIRLDGLNRSLVRHWIDRSKSEDNYVNKFICIWIAFNHYYATYWLDSRTETRITHIRDKEGIDELIEHPICQNIYTDLFSNCSLTIELPVKSVITSKEIPPRRKGDTPISNITIQENFDILYQIRNNLFHGRKDPSKAERDTALCKFGYGVLFPFLNKLMEATYPYQR